MQSRLLLQRPHSSRSAPFISSIVLLNGSQMSLKTGIKRSPARGILYDTEDIVWEGKIVSEKGKKVVKISEFFSQTPCV